MLSTFIREEFKRNWLTRIAGLIAMPVLRAFRNRADPRQYNGATLIGLNSTVIKSHGGADALAFEHAILEALAEVKNQVPQRIGRELLAMQGTGQVA